MKKTMVICTVVFPFGEGETPFLQPELVYLKERYNIVVISQVSRAQYDKYESNRENYPEIRFINYFEKISVIDVVKYTISYFGTRDGRQDFIEAIGKKNRVKAIMESLSFYIKAKRFSVFLMESLSNIEEELLFYSFWYNQTCYAILHYIKCRSYNDKVFTRTHGVDLYHERRVGGRQPFKKQMDNDIDQIIFASDYALKYYLNYIDPALKNTKYSLCRLGSFKINQCKDIKKHDSFLLVSCSYVINLKRIDLIVKALNMIEDIQIEWIHFGDGEAYSYIESEAKRLLCHKENIQYTLKGFTRNKEVRGFYQNNYVDCFITTTSTEGGCPMAIQEAMMFGTPIIGTDVGGVTEMIDNNGYILSSNPDIDEIKDAIVKIVTLSAEERNQLRYNSLKRWENMFDITKNIQNELKVIENL